MAARRYGTSRAFSSTSPSVFSSDRSVLSFISSPFLSLSANRRLILVSAFLIGFVLTVIMKREHLLWLLTTAAGAAPILEFGQGSQFDLPGLRFGVDRKFKISVFEDLHFGERKLKFPIDAATVKFVLAPFCHTCISILTNTSCDY